MEAEDFRSEGEAKVKGAGVGRIAEEGEVSVFEELVFWDSIKEKDDILFEVCKLNY